MRIGIIGAGNIGGTLARRLTELGHYVEIANSRGPQTLADVAESTGATAVEATDAPEGKDVLVITIPEAKVPDLPDGLLADTPDDLVIVDTGNYYPRHRDGAIDPIESGTPESVWVSEQIGRPVVKAFNNIYAPHLGDNGREPGAADRIALPVAGDDERAKEIVRGLVEELGFDAVDAGSLAESWRQQPGTALYTADLDADALRTALAEASPERPDDFTATADSPGTFEQPA